MPTSGHSGQAGRKLVNGQERFQASRAKRENRCGAGVSKATKSAESLDAAPQLVEALLTTPDYSGDYGAVGGRGEEEEDGESERTRVRGGHDGIKDS